MYGVRVLSVEHVIAKGITTLTSTSLYEKRVSRQRCEA
jgi:hypothetical protein